MKTVKVSILSAGLPEWLGKPSAGSSHTMQLLGLILGCDTLRLLEILFADGARAELDLIGYLRTQGFDVLLGTFMKYTQVYNYLRPLATSITELRLDPSEIRDLPHNDAMIDAVMARHVSNLLDDLNYFMKVRMPGREFQGTGRYLSRVTGRLVECRPIARDLTPRFGTLTFVVSEGDALSLYPTFRYREI